MSARLLGVLASLFLTVVVLRLVMGGRLRTAYAALWLGVSVAMIVLATVPHLLEHTSDALGFAVPANFLFFSTLVLLGFVGIHLSVAVTALEDRTQRLAEEVALLADQAHRP